MLSVQECKQYLPPGRYTDEEVEKIRTSLYQLAEILVSGFIAHKKPQAETKTEKTTIERRPEHEQRKRRNRSIE